MDNTEHIFDVVGREETLSPTFDVELLNFNNAERPLTSHEMRQHVRHQTITMLGYSVEKLDRSKSETVINKLVAMYPFLTYKIDYDPELRWCVYKREPGKTIHLSIADEVITDHVHGFDNYDRILNDNLVSFELFDAAITELPTIKQLLVVQILHSLVDAQNFTILMRLFNKFYAEPEEMAKRDYVEVTNFRPIFSISKLLVGKTLEQHSSRKIPQLARFCPGTPSQLKAGDIVNNNLSYFPSDITQYKLKGFNLTSEIYAAMLAVVALEANRYEEQSDCYLLADIKNIRKYLSGLLPEIADEDTAGLFFVPNFIFCRIQKDTTLSALLAAVMEEERQPLSPERIEEIICKCDYNAVKYDDPIEASAMGSNLGRIDLGLCAPIVQTSALATERTLGPCSVVGLSVIISSGALGTIISNENFKVHTDQHNERLVSGITNVLRAMKEGEDRLDRIQLDELSHILDENM